VLVIGDGSSDGRTPDCGSGSGGFESPLSPEDYWIAGLLEGEGSFGCPSPSSPGRISVKVEMTDLDVIERVAQRWGSKVYMPAPRAIHHKQSYVTRIYGPRALAEMRLLRPLMGKRRQCQIDAAMLLAASPKEKLTAGMRKAIAVRRRGGERAIDLAAEFGITREYVYVITRASG
jgi:hypothetical protein